MGTERDYVRNFYEGFGTEKYSNESLTQVLENESHDVTTVIIFVISAVLVIILIFVMAVFIDCRQQKLDSIIKSQKQKKPSRRKFPTLPVISETTVPRDDALVIVEHMEEPEPSSMSIPYNIV